MGDSAYAGIEQYTAREIRKLEQSTPEYVSPFVGGKRLQSVLEFMQRFYAIGLVYTLWKLGCVTNDLSSRPQDSLRAHLCEIVAELDEWCSKNKLNSSAQQTKRILRYAEKGVENHVLVTHCNDLSQTIVDDLGLRGLYQLLPQEFLYYEGAYFDPVIVRRFSDARFDLKEAGRCFAFERWTATVFHLMRVIEVGLKDMAIEAGVDPHGRSWAYVINKCEEADTDKDLVAHLRLIKDAWRNETMHVTGRYGQQDAIDIMNLTVVFMRRLAVRGERESNP